MVVKIKARFLLTIIILFIVLILGLYYQFFYKNINKIYGIYELGDTVVFTLKEQSATRVLHWQDPSTKAESYMGTGVVFNLGPNSLIRRGQGYQIVLVDSSGVVVKKSKEYLFNGNRIVLDDPRCPELSIGELQTAVYRSCRTSVCVLEVSDSSSCPLF